MLIYLFFIFTCGWCVCWLIFLNYQQHIKDSKESASCSSNLRASNSQEHEDEAEGECCAQCRCSCSSSSLSSSARQPAQAELIVNERGDHSVLLAGFSQAASQIELNGDLFALDEECGSLFGGSHTSGGYQLQQQQQAACWREPSVEIRGWPDGVESGDSAVDFHEVDIDDFVLLNAPSPSRADDSPADSMWPIAGLHENPMNWLPADALRQSAADRERRALSDQIGGDGEGESQDSLSTAGLEQSLLERSRLLSLQASQLRNRAAIRMVSSSTVWRRPALAAV